MFNVIQRSSFLSGLLWLLICVTSPFDSAFAAGPVTAGAGDSITIPDGTTVQGSTDSAITATDGGKVSGVDTHAIGAGTSQPAVIATGAGSVISLTGAGTVIDSSRIGAQMSSGGLVRLGDSATINITGVDTVGSAGIRVQTLTPADAFGSGIVINIIQNAPRTVTNGQAWIGVSVESGGSAIFDNLTVQGNGVNMGAYATGAGTNLTMNNSNISVNGDASGSVNIWPAGGVITGLNELGIAVRSGAVLNLNSTSLTHSVSGSVMGLYSELAGSTINADNVTVTMSGSGNPLGAGIPGGSSAGVYALTGGMVNIKNSRVEILGNNFGGIRVGNGGIVNGDGLEVITRGVNDSALRYNGTSNTINLVNSTLSGLGPGNLGLIVNNTTGVQTLNMTGGTMNSTAQALYINNGNALFNFSNGARVTGENGILLDATVNNSHAAVVAGSGSILSGDMQTATQNSVSASLDSGSLWTGAARNIGDVSAAGGATWKMTGNSDVLSLALNSGTVSFSSPDDSNFKTLTVRGDYSGMNGLVALNTRLGGNDSPTDMLVVQGDTSGSSGLLVSNAGGSGAATSGDGIRVIEVLGASNGTFALRGRAAAGLYEYTLHRGENESDWYLRSDLPDQPGTPNIRPEVPLATALIPLGIEYGYFMLDTLHQRVGESRKAVGVPKTEDRVQWLVNPWARALGERLFHNAGGSFLDNGASYDYSMGGIQAGLDIYADTPVIGPQNYVGAYLGYGRMDAGVEDVYGGESGDVDMDAYSLGAYWTRYSTPDGLGWYSDVVLQGTLYHARAKSDHDSSFSGKGRGVLASWENGYAFDLGDNITLEPQAQLAYQYVTFLNTEDSYGSFAFSGGSSLRGRVGVRLAKHFNAGTEQEPRSLSVWGRANVWQEFLRDSNTTVAGPDGSNSTSIPSRFDRTWGEVELGLSGQVDRNLSLFATGDMLHSLDGNDRKGWGGRIGFRYEW